MTGALHIDIRIECTAQSGNSAQRLGHDPTVGQFNVNVLVVEVDSRDGCLAQQHILGLRRLPSQHVMQVAFR